MPIARLILIALLATLPVHAQEESAEPEVLEAAEVVETPEPIVLPAEVAADFEARIAVIERQERAADRLQKAFEGAEGITADVYGGRMDALWADMFDGTVKLAEDIATHQDEGFDVEYYAEEIAEDLRVFPEESEDALARLRASISYPTEDLEPSEFAIQDQKLLRATQKMDFVLQSMLTYLDVADRLGIEDPHEIDDLILIIEDSAANRSTFLQLSIENVTIMRAAAAALPTDTDVTARLAVSEARVNVSSSALQSIVNLMNQLDLDASQYSQQVVTTTGELTSDVLDVGVIAAIASEWSTLVADLAKTQGPRLLFRLLVVVLILFLFTRLSRVVQSLTKRALASSKVGLSNLLREMIVASAKNLVVMIGILIALSQLGISLGPLLAGLGIAGFIIGFALQDTLSNFASGMLILIYRPFDVGDFVTAGGVTGKVSHMSLVNATFKTIDNQVLVVPNNLIWSSVITNVTAQRLRRVDLMFGVAYSDDIEKVERILAEVVAEHELVLDDPEPMIRLHELADSSVNFVLRPWVKTDDYWEVYWDLLRTVKMRFDAEGITIPFPQREIHNAVN